MTEPIPDSRGRDIDVQPANDGTGDTEGDCVEEPDTNAGGQHASADVAPELFGW